MRETEQNDRLRQNVRREQGEGCVQRHTIMLPAYTGTQNEGGARMLHVVGCAASVACPDT